MGRLVGTDHRIRIKGEEKTKVVPSVWGTEVIQFLAALAACFSVFCLGRF